MADATSPGTDSDPSATQLYVFRGLSRLRADKGLSKTDLAGLSGVAVNTLSSAERRVGNRLEILMKIFNALNSRSLYDGALVRDELIVRR